MPLLGLRRDRHMALETLEICVVVCRAVLGSYRVQEADLAR